MFSFFSNPTKKLQKDLDQVFKSSAGSNSFSVEMSSKWPDIKLNLEKGADINALYNNCNGVNDLNTLLQYTCQAMTLEEVKYLISKGAELEIEDQPARGILSRSASNTSNGAEIIKYLIEEQNVGPNYDPTGGSNEPIKTASELLGDDSLTSEATKNILNNIKQLLESGANAYDVCHYEAENNNELKQLLQSYTKPPEGASEYDVKAYKELYELIK